MTNVYAAMARKRTAVEKIKQVGLYYEVFGPSGLWIFARTRHLADRPLDFVLFLDGVPAEHRARFADVEAFCASINRPRGFNE